MGGRLLAVAAVAAAVSEGVAGAATLSTGFAGGNGFSGNMFDVTIGPNPITFTGLELHITNSSTPTANAYFYFREGGFQFFATDASAWTLQDTGTLTAQGFETGTPWDIVDLTLDANTTYGFYVGIDTTDLAYSDGTSIGTVAASNADLTIFEGLGYGTTPFGGETFATRVWNGTIEYTVGTGGEAVVPLPAGLPLMLGALAALAMLKRRSGT